MSLFQLLLSHSSWLVVHHSLLAFRQFAEVQYMALTAPNSPRATNIYLSQGTLPSPPPQSTPYASVVEQCIPPSLSDLVVDFLKCVPFLSSSRPELAQREFWLQELGKRRECVERWREGGVVAGALEETGDSSNQDIVRSWLGIYNCIELMILT